MYSKQTWTNGEVITDAKLNHMEDGIALADEKQDISNLVTSLSSSSTNAQYPSAKCVYDLIGNVESLLADI